jgi:hypothetical protein
MKSMTDEIAELRALPTAELAQRYAELYGREPRVRHREFLWKRIAWKIQEQRTGGLSQVARDRLEQLIAEIDIPLGETTRTVAGKLRAPIVRPETNKDGLMIGSTVTRDWRGTRLLLRVVPDGYEVGGVPYKSLSAAAFGVTGAKWNGPLFWRVNQ